MGGVHSLTADGGVGDVRSGVPSTTGRDGGIREGECAAFIDPSGLDFRGITWGVVNAPSVLELCLAMCGQALLFPAPA